MSPDRMKIVGVVLAAGAGTRFGGPKALARRGQDRFVEIVVRALQQAGIGQVIVISGAWDGEVVGAEVVHNPQWSEGISTSLRLGLESAAGRGADAALITLVDLPDLTADQVARILATPGELVQASYDGQPGHPVKVGRAHFAAMAAAVEGDRGARHYLLTHGVREVPLPGSLEDIDEAPLA